MSVTRGYEDKLRNLSLRLGEISLTPNEEDLAKVALELIVSKRGAMEITEGDYPKEFKNKAKKALSEFEELEERIVRIYGMGLLSDAKWAHHPTVKTMMGEIRRRKGIGAIVYERRS